MSILIKGMEMPREGELLCINIYPDGKVCIDLDLECSQIATAVPVPPHGRLIDADALKMMLDEEIARLLEKGTEYLDYRVDTLFSDFKQYVDKMPTIIPAEEGET